MENMAESVRITVTFGDGSKPQYVVDAHPDDPEVKRLLERGKKQARRGRQPKTAAKPLRAVFRRREGRPRG